MKKGSTGSKSSGRRQVARVVTEPPPHPEESLFEDDEYEYASMRRILLASLDTFAELGYHGTATRDISRRAQVSAGALYTHYESKQALLDHIIRVTHQRMLERMRAASAEGGTPTDRLRRIVVSHVRFHAEYNIATRVANYELHSLDDQARKEIRLLRDDMEQVVREVIALGCRAGEFEMPDQQLVTMYILSLGIDVSRWFRAKHRLTPDELAEEYARLVLHAITPARPAARRAPQAAVAKRPARKQTSTPRSRGTTGS
jgi:AcrR family transcriptional regulator